MIEFHGLVWPKSTVEARGWEGAEKHTRRYISSAKKTIPEVIKNCEKTDLVIQAGGHCGAWPRYLANHFAEVYTWEAHPDNFACLQINAPKANARRAALGRETSTVAMKINQRNTGGHKCLPEPGDIPVEAIDDFDLAPDAILLDIEGMELPALEGAERTIMEYKPAILIEDRGHGDTYGWGSPWQWLGEHGYKPVAESGHDWILKYDA